MVITNNLLDSDHRLFYVVINENSDVIDIANQSASNSVSKMNPKNHE